MAAITTSRSWAILDRFVRRGDDGCSHSLAARLTNSRGDPLEVCIELNAPPRPSNLILRWPDGPTDGEPVEPIAAHGGAVLLLMQYAIPVRNGRLRFPMTDYFVYSIVGTTPPALRRLPPIGGTIEEVQARVQAEGIRASKQTLRRMEFLDTGIIVRSREHFAVVELIVDVTDANVARPEVRVFNPRASSDQWVLKKPRVVPVHENHDLWYWETDAVVPWGGTYLCWVDYSAGGIMLHDVFDDGDDADILFLELPARKHHLSREDGIGKGNMNAYHTLGTTDSGDTLKFAFVLRHDDVLVRHTGRDEDDVPADFSVLTWKLRTEGGTSMLWEEDNGIAGGCNLWAQDDFKLIPRGVLLYPVFSADDPNEVGFYVEA